MATVYVKGQRHQLSPNKVIGKGGEAEVYQLGIDTVLKLYKRPDDPDYHGNPDAQAGAIHRLKEHQRKLPAFPQGLPDQVVTPIDLAYANGHSQEIVGYTMRYLNGMEVLLSLGDRSYREQGGVDGNQAVKMFQNLHHTVRAVHTAKIVVGDFNDLNVLFDQSGNVYMVDADSMQFGQFYCRTFTLRFVDPLNCESSRLVLATPHTPESDWYAFNTMLFQSLLYVGPYGGVHRPRVGKRLQHEARVLQRLTVFDNQVQYPKPALPFDRLPDELLEHFHQVYKQDVRGIFPLALLQALRWTTCVNCGAMHARRRCPACAAPGMVTQSIVRRGKVTATRLYQTRGRILHAAVQNGTLRYLYHEDGAFQREGDQYVVSGNLDPSLRYRIQGNITLLGKRERLLAFDGSQEPTLHHTDTINQLALFDANGRHRFWIEAGQLMRDGKLGAEYVGDVLSGRTLFWTGNNFGFGFYQAGQLMRAFVFDTNGRGLNDQVPLPTLPGQLIDAACVFSDQLAWFMISLQESGRLVNRCFVVDSHGNLLAETSANQGDSSWLGVGIRGHFASGNSLFASTDDGIVRITVDHGTIGVAQTFPDTEPFVDATTQLLPAPDGIYAVFPTHITLLTIR